MGIVLMVFGIIMSILGGIGFVVTENWMNDPDFWWDYAGTGRYTSAINMHSISMVVLGAGVLFLLLGVVLYATRRSNGQQVIYQNQRRKESVRYENKGIGKEYAVAGMVFTGLGIAAVAAGCIFWISPLIIILVLLFFPLGIIFSRIAAKRKKHMHRFRGKRKKIMMSVM